MGMDRRLNTNEQQLRLEAVVQANMNAAQGTPVRVILAEALVIIDFVQNGPDAETQMLKRLKENIIDPEDAEAFLRMMEKKNSVPAGEEEHSGEIDGEPVVLRDEVHGTEESDQAVLVVDDVPITIPSGSDIADMRAKAIANTEAHAGIIPDNDTKDIDNG